MKFVGNSSSGELFAEHLDDIRIYDKLVFPLLPFTEEDLGINILRFY